MYQIIPKARRVEHIILIWYLLIEADDSDKITAQYKEVHDVRWVTRKSIIDEYDTFDSVRSFAKACSSDKSIYTLTSRTAQLYSSYKPIKVVFAHENQRRIIKSVLLCTPHGVSYAAQFITYPP